jgi:hypothetical protein
MVSVLGPAPKPQKVWEEQFDGFNDKLGELARMDRVPDEYLWYLQPDLFRYLFPTCLKCWYEALMRNEDASRGDGDFHYALLRGQIRL